MSLFHQKFMNDIKQCIGDYPESDWYRYYDALEYQYRKIATGYVRSRIRTASKKATERDIFIFKKFGCCKHSSYRTLNRMASWGMTNAERAEAGLL